MTMHTRRWQVADVATAEELAAMLTSSQSPSAGWTVREGWQSSLWAFDEIFESIKANRRKESFDE